MPKKGPIEQRIERIQAIEREERPCNQAPAARTSGPACVTCKRHSWRWITMDGHTCRATMCCLGPGDPWLPNQSEADKRSFVDRTVKSAQAADHMYATTGVRI